MCKERLEVVTPRSRSCITAYFGALQRARLPIFFCRSSDRLIRTTGQVGADAVAGDEVLEKTRL